MAALVATRIVDVALRDGLRPVPALTVSEWADMHRILSSVESPEPGRWRTDRVPYLREIMDCLSVESEVQEIAVMKGGQVGFTEVGNNAIGYWMTVAPGPILYAQPRREDAEKYSKQRIDPMIRSTPILTKLVAPERSRSAQNNVRMKSFPGGFLHMIGANSPSALASTPAGKLFGDEIDRWPGDVRGEGNPVKLFRKRAANFGATRKILLGGTPTTAGVSRTEQEMMRSDWRYWFVRCPRCGHEGPIFWNEAYAPPHVRQAGIRAFVVRWPKDDPDRAYLSCPACEKEIDEGRKTELLAGGKWVPTRTGEGLARGYHISSLYSPAGWTPWGECAKEFLDCKRRGPLSLQTFVNLFLGQPWTVPGDAIEVSPLLARLEPYPAEVPARVLMLTAGVDIQDDRVEAEVVGWGHPGAGGEECESWSIAYSIFRGPITSSEVRRELDDFLLHRWQHETGARLSVVATCVDSGHLTQSVYSYCRPRADRRVFAIKGQSGDLPIVSPSTRKPGGKRKGDKGLTLYIVGTDTSKALLYSHLRKPRPGPGYCHFPAKRPNYDEEYFEQLVSERRVPRVQSDGRVKHVWEMIRDRNEALDCRVYATAARYIANPDWDAIAHRLGQARPEPEAGEVPAKKKRPASAPQHPFREAMLRNRRRRSAGR